MAIKKNRFKQSSKADKPIELKKKIKAKKLVKKQTHAEKAQRVYKKKKD